MIENIKPAELTIIGRLTIEKPSEGGCHIVAEGFEGNEQTSCRDVAALVCVWAIGELQKELAAILREPGGTGSMGVD